MQEGSRLENHQHRVTSVDFTPNGEQLASAGEDGTIVIWDLKSEKIIPNKLPKNMKVLYGGLGLAQIVKF